MERISDAIGALSVALSITRGEAATLLAVTGGSALSLLATLAAWFAALGTLASVREMRAARFDKQKPVLIYDHGPNWTFEWERADDSTLYKKAGDESEERSYRNPSIQIRNAGTGAAVQLEIALPPIRDVYSKSSDITHLKRIFFAAGLTVARSDHGISFLDNDEEIARWYFDANPTSIGLPVIAPGESKNIEIPASLVESYLIKCLSEDMESDSKNMAWVMPVRYSYRTSAGQLAKGRLALVLSYSRLALTVGDPPEMRNGVPNWSKLSAEFSLYITNSWQGPGFWHLLSSLVSRKFLLILSGVHEIGDRIDQSLAQWIFFKGQPQFKIGDKVSRIVDGDWNLETPNPDDIDPIPEDSWDHVDRKRRRKRK